MDVIILNIVCPANVMCCVIGLVNVELKEKQRLGILINDLTQQEQEKGLKKLSTILEHNINVVAKESEDGHAVESFIRAAMYSAATGQKSFRAEGFSALSVSYTIEHLEDVEDTIVLI